ETARLLSQMAGETTVRHQQRTRSATGTSLSEPEVSRPLMTTDEAMRLPEDAALIFSSGIPAAWARKLRYYQQPAFARRARIAPPQASDRLCGEAPPEGSPPSSSPEGQSQSDQGNCDKSDPATSFGARKLL